MIEEEVKLSSQFSKLRRKTESKYDEVLLNDDGSMSFKSIHAPSGEELMPFHKSDFDFFDLQAVTTFPDEGAGVTQKVKYFVFRYKNKITYQRTRWAKETKENPNPKNSPPIS